MCLSHLYEVITLYEVVVCTYIQATGIFELKDINSFKTFNSNFILSFKTFFYAYL